MSIPDTDLEEMYYQKYLRYKTKYLNLKQYGGVTLTDGTLCFFTTDPKATDIEKLFQPQNFVKGKPPKFDEIKKVLNKDAYMIKDLDNEITLVKGSVDKKSKNEQPGESIELLDSLKYNQIFNRCSMTQINNVREIIMKNNMDKQGENPLFTPTAVVVLQINKAKPNKFVNRIQITGK